MMVKVDRRAVRCVFSALFIMLLSVGNVFTLQGVEDRERKAEELLSRADIALQKGEYKSALDTYLEAAALTEKKMNLSKAYFGISMAYFSLGDTTNSKKWLRNVLEVDPNKEISALFYPESFVRLFNEVRKESASEEDIKTGELKERMSVQDAGSPSRKTDPSDITRRRIPPPERIDFGRGDWWGKWEVEVHYSSWSMNQVKGLFEDYVGKKLGSEIRKEMAKQVRKSHPGLFSANYEQSFAFDSEGSNYGLEIRIYPRGKESAFSLGFSLERTKIRLVVVGAAKENFTDGSYAQADAEAYVETAPLTTNLSLRWDFVPSWRVSPYFILGLGLAPLKGEIGYTFSGFYHWGGPREVVDDSQVKTFIEVEEEGDFNIPNIFILLQAGLGLRADIFKGLCLKAEAAFWNGFLIRGGLAFRF